MKTLFIIYYDLDIGGIQRKITDIINNLDKHKKHIRIILILKNKNKRAHQEAYIHHINHIVIYRYYASFLSKFPFCFPLYTVILALRYKPYAILSFSLIPSLSALCIKLCVSHNIKVIITEEAAPTLYEIQNKFGRIRKLLYKTFYKYADVIFTVNTSHQKELAMITGIKKNHIRITKNWMQLSKPPTSLSTNSKTYDLLYIGRLDPIKQVSILLKMTEQLKRVFPRIRVCIVGDGTEKQLLTTYVNDHGLKNTVTFVGFSYNPELYIKQSKIFVFPSFNEGMPFALIEAMSYGMPIVCNNFPSSEEIVQHKKTGFIYHSNKEMFHYIQMLLRHAPLRKKIGMQGFSYAHTTYTKKNIQTYIKELDI